MFKMQKAAFAFSKEELKNLVDGYPSIRHLREAYAIKCEKTLKVYVASPYDTVLNAGFSVGDAFYLASKAQDRAKHIFSSKFSFFVPVLEFGELNISRDEAMKMCFNELKKCDFLFIADVLYNDQSKGIKEEYEFAKANHICVVFENLGVKERFLKDER